MQKIRIKLEFGSAWIEEKEKAGEQPLDFIRDLLSAQVSDLEIQQTAKNKLEIVLYDNQKSRELKEMLKETISSKYNLQIQNGDYSLMTQVQIVNAPDEKGQNQEGTTPKAESKEQTKKNTSTDIKEVAGNTETSVETQETEKEDIDPSELQKAEEFYAFLEEYRKIIKGAKAVGYKKLVWTPTILLAMDDGFGLTVSLEKLADELEKQGICHYKNEKKRVKEFLISEKQLKDYYTWEKVLEEIKRYSEQLEDFSSESRGIPCVICFDLSESRKAVGTDDFRRILLLLNQYKSDFLYVFRIPYVEQIALNAMYQALSDVFFTRKVEVSPVDTEVLVDYAYACLREKGFAPKEELAETIEKRIVYEKSDGRFHGYKTIDKMVDEILYDKMLNTGETMDKTIAVCDLSGKFEVADSTEEDPYEALGALCGMENVKQTIDEIVSQIHLYREMHAKGSKIKAPCMHMRFLGNPGTGKTTVARLVAQIFKQEGILKKGYFYEIKARDLCGTYIGETAPKTSRYCNDALGSVLFIDEAYSLYRSDSDRDYGKEALDTLVTEMENNRDNLIVIMAGYEEEMNEMLKANPGLESRMPYTVSFRNYTGDELIDIFYGMLDNQFVYDDKFDTTIRNFFQSISDDVMKSSTFSNARMVRNLYERIWSKAAYRMRLSGEKEMRLMEEDVLQVLKDETFADLLVNDRKKIGFV